MHSLPLLAVGSPVLLLLGACARAHWAAQAGDVGELLQGLGARGRGGRPTGG